MADQRFVMIGLHKGLQPTYAAICDALGIAHKRYKPEEYNNLYQVALPLEQAQALYDVASRIRRDGLLT
jgi:hypothetical protein